MALTDNERLQEMFLVLGDRFAAVNKRWWYVLFGFVVLIIPIYFVLKFSFVNVLLGGYEGPKLIYTTAPKQALEIIDRKILQLSSGVYTGFIKIRNIELEWGVGRQNYSAEFKTYGGTVVQRYDFSTYILPSSEKLLILPRFNSDTKPDELVVTLGETHFIRKPDLNLNFDVERTAVSNNSDGLVVSSAFRNLTPFNIRQVDLPVVVFNAQNEIVAVAFTYVNDVESNQTRSFQYTWPQPINGAVRAEINPDINIFDRNVVSTEANPPTTSSDRP